MKTASVQIDPASHPASHPGRATKHGLAAFLREFLKSPKELGTLFPSSNALGKAMVEGLDLSGARAVVELGPGNGPLTTKILERIGPETRFFGIESNAGLSDQFRERFPGVPLYTDDAANIRALCERAGIRPGEVDVIISSIPFLLFDQNLQQRILHASAGVLRPGGLFTTVTNRPEKLMPSVRRFRRLMQNEFSDVWLERVVLANPIPTFIYRATR